MECSDLVNIALEISKTIGVMARLRHFLQNSVLLTQCLQFPYPSISLLWPCGLRLNFNHKSWKNLGPSEKSSTLMLLL